MAHKLVTTYFEGEGRAHMRDCIDLAASWCLQREIRTLVIFTGTGEGAQYAAKELLPLDTHKSLNVVAVTPPAGRPYRLNPSDPDSPLVRAGIDPMIRDELRGLGVEVVSAHLPFKEIETGGPRASEWSRVADAYGVLGGGFALAVQAAMVACDAGFVTSGASVVAATADTAISVVACRTDEFLSPRTGLIVEHVVCRPARYPLSKPRHQLFAPPAPPPSPPPVAVLELAPPKSVVELPPVEVTATKRKVPISKKPNVKRATKKKGAR